MKPQFLIGGATSGSGKTVFALGLLRALRKRGIKVQPYKCGPGFMDTQLHAISAGVDSVNLDSWFAGRTHLQYVYNKYGEKSDVCMIEGNSALFDGYKRMQGSSAEMAQVVSVPVILVVNARSAAYSVAPMLYGYKLFRPQIKIVGVVFTHVSSLTHFSYLKDACNDAGLNSLGYIPFDESLKLPQRHTALTQSVRSEIEEVSEKAAMYVEQNIDLDRILKMCTRIFPCEYTLPYTSDVEETGINYAMHKSLKIAVARDSAFNLLYKENIDRLSAIGRVTYFSPLYSNNLPEADIIYIPGGFPEMFARQLHRRKTLMKQLKDYADKGGKIIAEGGGMVLLSRSLTVREGGSAYEMSGVLPFGCTMIDSHLHTGYRIIEMSDKSLRGHEFRFLSIDTGNSRLPSDVRIVPVMNTRGAEADSCIYRYRNVIAGFTHWYWGETDVLRFWD
ncbi:cobyrinate a,c-diamide synthase [uncultured Bacteroides sp.]|uniref:cobyrinate a,c-diamide synthase n=1 Tax=uncultured Bacteroides sp. TaxID=162156 RepID=UPI0026222643|nr:cobyrinate a,c-diamide synthase [uncultured Bacteroides sp.]